MHFSWSVFGFASSISLVAADSPSLLSERASQCGVRGYDLKTKAYFYQESPTLATKLGCVAKCVADTRCKSYAVGEKACMLYTVAVTGNFVAVSNSPNYFYDRECVPATSSTSSSSSSTRTSSTTKTSSTTSSVRTLSSSRTSSGTTSRSSTTTSSAPSTSSTNVCGVKGYDKRSPVSFKDSTATTYRSLSGCSALCKATTGCKSFTFSTSVCYLYDAVLAKNINPVSNSPYTFYDLACFDVHSSSSSSASSTSSTPSTSSATFTSISSSVSPVTSPTASTSTASPGGSTPAAVSPSSTSTSSTTVVSPVANSPSSSTPTPSSATSSTTGLLTATTTTFTSSSTFAYPTDAIGTESYFDGPMILPPAPTVITKPINPLGVDMGSINVVTPGLTNQLWYSSLANISANITETIARVSITYQYPSVALDQSIYIRNVTCTGTSMTVVFNNSAVYSYIAPLWRSNPQTLFVTAVASCSADGQNTFFLTGTVTCDDSSTTCSATGSAQALADVFSNLDADWGDLTPTASTSNTTSSPSACTSPSSAVISGLPAAACGSKFDDTIDASLGFYSGDEADLDAVLAQVAPGTQSPLTKRGLFSKLKAAVNNAVKKVATAVAKAVVTVAKAVVKGAVKYVAAAAKTIAKTVVGIAKGVYNLAKFIVTGDYDQEMNMHMDIGPPSSLLLKSPWNNDQLGFKFYHFGVDEKDSGYSFWANALENVAAELGKEEKPEPGVDFWCVGCGIRGDVKATGSLSANLKGVSKAQLAIKGNMYAGMFLGIDAFATIGKTYNKTLFKQGLPTLSIPHIFTLGPSLSMGVSAGARVELIGRILAGASVNWPNINGTIDFLDKSKTNTAGFTPIVNATLQTTKSAKLILSLGLPASINFGLDILDGKYKKEATLTDTPALAAVLDYEEQMTITGSTEDGGCGIVDTTPSTGCYGVYWNITAINDLEFNLFDIARYNLAHWESKVLAEGCVGTKATNASKVDTCSKDNSTSTSIPAGQSTAPPAAVVSTPATTAAGSAASSTPAPAAGCTGSLAFYAPAGSTCFTITGHGPSHIDGKLLSATPGYAGLTFQYSAAYTPSTFYIDSRGYLYIVSSVGNHWVMNSYSGSTATWLQFMDDSYISTQTDFLRGTCSLNPSSNTIGCTSANGVHDISVESTYSASDSRSSLPSFGFPSSGFTAITMTYNVVSCPVAC